MLQVFDKEAWRTKEHHIQEIRGIYVICIGRMSV